jgi:hypothetical protein
MTPDQFRTQAELILVQRAATLKPHQIQDLKFSVAIVERKGQVSKLYEYYLTIVGVPCKPSPVRKPEIPKHLKKPVQGGLFD